MTHPDLQDKLGYELDQLSVLSGQHDFHGLPIHPLFSSLTSQVVRAKTIEFAAPRSSW